MYLPATFASMISACFIIIYFLTIRGWRATASSLIPLQHTLLRGWRSSLTLLHQQPKHSSCRYSLITSSCCSHSLEAVSLKAFLQQTNDRVRNSCKGSGRPRYGVDIIPAEPSCHSGSTVPSKAVTYYLLHLTTQIHPPDAILQQNALPRLKCALGECNEQT